MEKTYIMITSGRHTGINQEVGKKLIYVNGAVYNMAVFYVKVLQHV